MIDRERLAELRAEVGEDDLADVVALFLEEADEVVARLEGGGLDRPDLTRALHALKGAALNLGLSELAALCAAAEVDPASPALPRVPACYAASRRALAGALAGARAA